MKLFRMTLGIFAAALMVGLLAGNADAGGKSDVKLTDGESKLVKANNQFGVELFKKLHKDGENTFISPTSIAIAMQMANRAAKGETLDEINTTMHTDGIDLPEANQRLKSRLGGRDDVTLNIANSLWADPARITLNKEYVVEMDEYFDSEVRAEDFNDPQTVETINGWISDKTEGMIPEMLKEIPPELVTYLINAIYFKGNWSEPFKKKDTKEADFHLTDGSTKKVQMMYRWDPMKYGEIGGTQVLSLPYGEDEDVAMWIALPKEGEMDALVESLSGDTVSTWKKKCWKKPGSIKLPRFKMKFKKELNEDLQELGIKTAFELGKADLSRLGKATNGQPLYISTVLHEAVIEVNEEGTEAAAATIVGVGAGGAPPKPFSMVCDRPFLILIADDVTGSILFMGTVYEPENLD